MNIRNRHRLRKKEAKNLAHRIEAAVGIEIPADGLEVGILSQHKVLLSDGNVIAFFVGDEPFPVVKVFTKYLNAKRYVVVDMGAVPYVTRGADVMCPGIVDADISIRAGDLVWVRDEKNGQPLAIGRSLMSGPALKSSKSGKGVETIHYVGDRLWQAYTS